VKTCLLGKLAWQAGVYLIFLEPYPQTKSRIRSKKGLFYAHREIFERTTTYGIEIEVSPGKTLLAGISQVTAFNINDVVYCMDELPFAFGLAVPQQKRTFANSRKNATNHCKTRAKTRKNLLEKLAQDRCAPCETPTEDFHAANAKR